MSVCSYVSVSHCVCGGRSGTALSVACRLMGAIISMPKTLSDEESLPGDRPRPINLRRSSHLPGSEPTYGWCLCCCCASDGWGVWGLGWQTAVTLQYSEKQRAALISTRAKVGQSDTGVICYTAIRLLKCCNYTTHCNSVDSPSFTL